MRGTGGGGTSHAVEAALEPILSFAYQAAALKDVARAGWVLRGVQDPESVADHTFGTALLCLLYAPEAGVDPDRAVAIALAHDVAEAVTGDFVARAAATDRDVDETVKSSAERAAIEALVPPAAGAVKALWSEYEVRSTPEALFVRDMNLLDMCLQALRYEAERRYDPSRHVPSAGGHTHLDEFFASALPRLTTSVGRRLCEAVWDRYRFVREAGDVDAATRSDGVDTPRS